MGQNGSFFSAGKEKWAKKARFSKNAPDGAKKGGGGGESGQKGPFPRNVAPVPVTKRAK